MTKVYYTKQRLEKAVKKSSCISDVIRLVKPDGVEHGARHEYVRKKIEKFGIDTSHFLSLSEVLSKYHRGPKRTPKELLVKNRAFIAHASQIRRALIESGRPYICEKCNNDGNWNGLKLTLEIDHINGNKRDDSPSNLRFLCPNCHSQTTTYRSKNRKVARVV